MPALFPCRCCGYRTLSSPGPASYEICPVCFWEDNDDRRGFAYDLSNAVSLTEGYRNFEAFGACEPEWRNEVRAPQASEARDAGWLPFAEQREVDRAALVEQISSAFGSLRILPGGMRLYEAELADGHGSEGPWALARKHDTYERVDEVPDEAIAQCYSSLSFFDPEGCASIWAPTSVRVSWRPGQSTALRCSTAPNAAPSWRSCATCRETITWAKTPSERCHIGRKESPRARDTGYRPRATVFMCLSFDVERWAFHELAMTCRCRGRGGNPNTLRGGRDAPRTQP